MKYPDRQSHAPGDVIPLSSRLFEQLRDYILKRTGIFFQDNKHYLLQSRLNARLKALKLHAYEDYYAYITSPAGRGEFTRMVSAITINETYFFRSEEHFNIIQKSILPRIIKLKENKPHSKIRIWSTACSGGDEPYTLAIILQHHFIKKYPHIQFEILASDIDPDIIQKAKKGIYNTYAIRNVPKLLLEKYFEQQGDLYKIKAEIAQHVRFKKINLADPMEMMGVHSVDLAICANVLIYFPNQVRQKVVSAIYNSLNAQGYFMVGFSETLFGIEHQFQKTRDGKSMTYQKR